ncbi:MAG: hypothetical protein MUO58_15690 [Anaerolineales bacterium]|jgi:hypothetical protein|nr:hypothetical protein [Anaerolineales bacterium]
MRKVIRIVGILTFLSLTLTACTQQGSAENAIEAYLNALVSKDVIRAVNKSCLDWEEGAHAEASSFEAVIVRLDGLACNSVGVSGDQTLVECEGKIIANYGGEDQDIPLSGRTYIAVFEDGEWRMCGYETGRGE